MAATEQDIAAVEFELNRRLREHHREVEERLMAGERDFEVLSLAGNPVRYEVPGWLRHPYRRARFALALRAAVRQNREAASRPSSSVVSGETD